MFEVVSKDWGSISDFVIEEVNRFNNASQGIRRYRKPSLQVKKGTRFHVNLFIVWSVNNYET